MRQRSRFTVALGRAGGFFLLWLVLMQSVKPGDLAVGLVATACATWTSLRLLPPERGQVRLLRLMLYLPHFAWQSLVAGIDVARRAFAPTPRLHAGFVDYRTGIPRGHARNNFATIVSLMPGTLPSGDGPDSIEFHCLDTTQPVAEEMGGEEKRLAGALVSGGRG